MMDHRNEQNNIHQVGSGATHDRYNFMVDMHFLQSGAPTHRVPKTKEWFESSLSDILGKEM